MYHLLVALLSPLPLALLLAGIGLANLFCKRRESWRRLSLLLVPWLAIVLISMPGVAFLIAGTLEWHFPPQPTRPTGVEAIVVLGGHVRWPQKEGTEAELADDSLRRCLHAAKLYHDGQPCLVIVSGGNARRDNPQETIAEVMRRFLLRLGVAEEDLLADNRSKNTSENARETSRLLREREIEHVLLVTDATHLLRADRCFRKYGIRAIPAGCHYQTTRQGWSLFSFLPSPGAVETVHEVAHEWLGYAYYRLRGRM